MANKHEVEVTEQATALELGSLKFSRTRRWVSASVLAAVALANHDRMHSVTSITASAAEQLELFREVTGEDIFAIARMVGGSTTEIERDEQGLITSITASIPTAFEYDYAEMEAVIDSLYGSAVPKKLLGDLAQTSVTTSTGQVQIISLGEWSLSWKRKTADATTTDDAEYESSVGSTKSWTIKAKYMFLDGDTTQETYVLGAISALENDANLWNFFPTVENGRDAFQGYAIIDGIDLSTGMGKCVALDVSLKGTGALKMLKQAAPIANANTVTGQSAQV